MKISFKTGCTLFGACGNYTDTGRVLIASTSDNEYIRGPRKPVFLTCSTGKYRIIHTPCLLKSANGELTDEGSDRGLNSAGFCWTRSWAVTKDCIPGYTDISAKEWFLDFGSSAGCVEEAIEIMERRSRPFGVNGNYIIGDAKGFLAAIEVGIQKFEVATFFTPQESGIITRVNRFETEIMKKLDDTKTRAAMYHETSALRQSRVASLIEKYRIVSIDTIKKILSDQKGNKQMPGTLHGAGICSVGLTHGTVSSEIFDPTEKIFYYRHGFPCRIPGNQNHQVYGYNVNSWTDWLPLRIGKMFQEGAYSSWDGNLTQQGYNYYSSLK